MRIRTPTLVLAALALASAAFALDPVFKTSKGIAIDGYDPVAYFVAGKPVKGSASLSADWGGATWWFSSEENRSTFRSDPVKYAPQYGGYCSKAVSEGHTAKIDPEAWDIVDGKLYLNYSLKVRDLWRKDIPGRIRRADENWPKLLTE